MDNGENWRVLNPELVRCRTVHPVKKRMNRGEVERMKGIEPTLTGWEPEVLPLNYIREI